MTTPADDLAAASLGNNDSEIICCFLFQSDMKMPAGLSLSENISFRSRTMVVNYFRAFRYGSYAPFDIALTTPPHYPDAAFAAIFFRMLSHARPFLFRFSSRRHARRFSSDHD